MEGNVYPISIICIIATEFCERFSFCGLRTILSLYLRNELRLTENTATMVYHVFIMICYILPVVGAICADSFLGRYRTILYFSVIYLLGNVLMIATAIPMIDFSPITMTVFGLTLISIGSGGSKPCLAAFGGDQFRLPNQQLELQQFFSLFYFSINLGGFVGMIITPVMRKAITCFGDDTCYALGFGFPALLILISLLIFVMGKPWYRMKVPKGNVVLQFVNCTAFALLKKAKSNRQYCHWLDHAKGKFNMKLIHDMKIVFAVLLLYTPLPLFWSLFDQQGSRWTFQASRMNDYFLGMQILPDQMQVINPALVLVFIPLFDRVVYPYLTRINCLENPLHRMAVGGLLAGLSFMSAGFLEIILQQEYPVMPGRHQASINFVNTLPCSVEVKSHFSPAVVLNASDFYTFDNIQATNQTRYEVTLETSQICGSFQLARNQYSMSLLAKECQTDTVLLGVNKEDELECYVADPLDFRDSLNERPRMRIIFIKSSELYHNITVKLKSVTTELTDVYYLGETPQDISVSPYVELPNGAYDYTVSSREKEAMLQEKVHLDLGGVYCLVIRERQGNIEFVKLFTILPPNSVNMLWLIPQYFLISVAEIMFGIAGLEFSFTQAPKSLKTVTIAAWYLSVAFGNLLVIIITQSGLFRNQAYEFFFFAVLIVGDMMLFIHMASEYNFVQLEADSSVALLEETPLLAPLKKLITANQSQ